MATVAELCTKTLTEVAGLIKKKEVSPVELIQAMLDRISALDGKLYSYITVTSDLALQQARTAEQEIARGAYRGPLHGIPIAVKDLCYTKGVRTTCASKILANWIPDYDATVIEKLNAAGAVLLGKLGMTEFAYGGYHPSVHPPVSPWNPERWPGASSSGSGVATAASLCFGSLGSDTGGSIRFPSAACGVVGVKPTYGKVSRYGVFPLGESLDHIGPMTRSVADAAVILRAIAGFDPKDPTTRRETVRDYLDTLYNGVKGIRIGVDEAYCTTGVDPQVSKAVLATTSVLRDLGASIQEVKVSGIEQATAAGYTIIACETAAAHEQFYPSRADDYGPTFRAFLEDGIKFRGLDYAKAHVARQVVCRMIDELLQKVDLLLCPSMPTVPALLKDFSPQGILSRERVETLLRHTILFNLTGSPTISVPCGFSVEGLPLSLQLIGRHGEEGMVMQTGHAYEQATEWHKRRPPV
ncbi:MAG: aspartyl/glutamyl-tRNA amidotransferase subunit A [Deltaproteobacteria bacterium]|nr:aspartyl/glutamyl-tRNA amidotransferase subunit A [Deltaproteobacteria bacterium]